MRIFFFILFVFISVASFAFPTKGKIPQNINDSYQYSGDNVKVVTWVENLEVPWSLVFLDEKTALVSERAGRIRIIVNNVLLTEPYIKLKVYNQGEGGLLGLAKHPEFPEKPFIYAMYTYKESDGIYNRVVRIKHEGLKGVVERIIIDKIPGAKFHNGGRIGFGPDSKLYITTGEIFESELAQNLNSLGGKILRLNDDGSIPDDNPFKNSPIYSYGHRNPQGMAWHPETKELFSTEHGPSGEFFIFGFDEVNIIKKGSNYGWAEVVGAVNDKRFIDPLIVWKSATPPSGITFYNGGLLKHLKGDLFIATLRSECLIRVKIKIAKESYKIEKIERWFNDEKGRSVYGRIRDIIEGPDGALYFLTNNTDGRGNPRKGDDKIFKIIPK